MITGVHAVIFRRDADGDRASLRDVPELPSVDAGAGWLIFALPPAALAARPADGNGPQELYLMCDDVHATIAELKAREATSPGPSRMRGSAWSRRSGPPAAGSWGCTSRGTSAAFAWPADIVANRGSRGGRRGGRDGLSARPPVDLPTPAYTPSGTPVSQTPRAS
jgi:hypothetical protein